MLVFVLKNIFEEKKQQKIITESHSVTLFFPLLFLVNKTTWFTSSEKYEKQNIKITTKTEKKNRKQNTKLKTEKLKVGCVRGVVKK